MEFIEKLKDSTFNFGDITKKGFKAIIFTVQKDRGMGYIVLIKGGEQVAIIEYTILFDKRNDPCFFCKNIIMSKGHTSKLYDITLYTAIEFFSKLKTLKAFYKNIEKIKMKIYGERNRVAPLAKKGRREVFFENGLLAIFESELKKDRTLKNSGNWLVLDMRSVHTNIDKREGL